MKKLFLILTTLLLAASIVSAAVTWSYRSVSMSTMTTKLVVYGAEGYEWNQHYELAKSHAKAWSLQYPGKNCQYHVYCRNTDIYVCTAVALNGRLLFVGHKGNSSSEYSKARKKR